MSAADIVVVGACNMDLITYAPKLPLPGETIYGNKYTVGFGGKGANQCVAAAKLGSWTALVARVGNDQNGREYIENLKQSSMTTDYVYTTCNSDTGIATILVGENGVNSIVIVPGANLLLSIDDITNLKHVIANAKVLLCQCEIDMKTNYHTLKLAKASDVTTIFNLAPAVEFDKEMLKYCDIFCVNETEASYVTKKTVKDISSAKAVSKQILEMGCKSCVITLGGDGCIYFNKSEMFEVPLTNSVSAVDTTGAGDCFLGALAYFIAHFPNLGMQEMLHRANTIASNSITKKGTQISFPSKADLPKTLFQ